MKRGPEDPSEGIIWCGGKTGWVADFTRVNPCYPWLHLFLSASFRLSGRGELRGTVERPASTLNTFLFPQPSGTARHTTVASLVDLQRGVGGGDQFRAGLLEPTSKDMFCSFRLKPPTTTYERAGEFFGGRSGKNAPRAVCRTAATTRCRRHRSCPMNPTVVSPWQHARTPASGSERWIPCKLHGGATGAGRMLLLQLR